MYCLAVVAGMAFSPLVMDWARIESTPFFRFLAIIAALFATASYFMHGVFALALQFFTAAFSSGALAVCLRQMTALLPPRRVGLFVGSSCACMALSSAALFFQPLIDIPSGIILFVMCCFLAAAIFCFDAGLFSEAAKQVPAPKTAPLPSNKRFARFALLVLCLYVLLGGLLDNLYYFGAAFGQIPNLMFYFLLYTACVDIGSGFAFERLNAAAVMIFAFALIFTGQALSLFAQNTVMVFPYALLSSAGNTTMEIYLISLPLSYCAAARRTGILPGFGYMLLYGGFFVVGVLMPGIDRSFILGAMLLITIAAIIVITYLISEGKAARMSILRRGFITRLADSSLSGVPTVERFSSSFDLTERETHILRQLLDDKSISYIAGKMNIAEKTVQTDVNSLLSKTGTKTIAEATSLFKRMAHQALVQQDIRHVINYQL